MKQQIYILSALVAVLFLAGCRSSSELKQKEKEEQESSRIIHEFMAAPVAEELTASLSININGAKVSGQLRMRQGRSIQISASVLGLMEMARVEFLPGHGQQPDGRRFRRRRRCGRPGDVRDGRSGRP